MGLVWLLLIAVGGVIALAVYAAIDTANKQRELSAAIAALPDFSCTAHYVGPTGNEGIAIDGSRGTVCFLHRIAGRLTSRVLSGRDIVRSDVVEETTTTAPARAISPVVMLGRYGVLLGGDSRKTAGVEKVTRIALKTIVNDAAAPVRTITFLASATEKGGSLHRYACESARQWQVRINALAWSARDVEVTAPPFSVADELRKLAVLKSDGLLTQEEFSAQRTKLLL